MIELVERPDGTLIRGFGGDTLNTAVYLARLGVAVEYVTALGDDPFSAQMLAAWREEGVGTALIPRLAGRLPGLYLIQTDAAGERRFSYWRDSAPARQLFALPETAAIEAGLERFGMVYLSGISLSLFGAEGRARLFAVLERLRRKGGRTVFDTNFRPRGWPDPEAARRAYRQMLACADIVLGSVEDLSLLAGIEDAAQAAAYLGDGGAAEIVVKLAEPGCVVHALGERMPVAVSVRRDAVDTTAAGDSFAAAYLAARIAGKTPAAAARAGHVLAGAVVGHRGAIIPRDAMPAVL
jgi:2-dehydro-3-deoxygluconokinase